MSENQDKKMFLPFRVDEYQFAVSAAEVESIVELPKFRPVPLTPASFMGVFSHRNKVVNLVSLQRKFGLADYNNSGYVILSQMETCLAGFHVDEIYKLISASDTIQTKIDWKLSFGSFHSILLHNNEMLIQTSFEQLFKLEEFMISYKKNINTEPTIKKDIENLTKPESELIKKKKIPECVQKPNHTANFQTQKNKDTKILGNNLTQKVSPIQKKYQAIKKTTKPLVGITKASLKIEQSDKKNILMFSYSWLVILIITFLVVTGVYWYNTREKQSYNIESSKMIFKNTQDQNFKSINLKQKPYNKSLSDSKPDKIVGEYKEVSAFVETHSIEQSLPNNSEKNVSSELSMYTRKKKEEWVKIEKKYMIILRI